MFISPPTRMCFNGTFCLLQPGFLRRFFLINHHWDVGTCHEISRKSLTMHGLAVILWITYLEVTVKVNTQSGCVREVDVNVASPLCLIFIGIRVNVRDTNLSICDIAIYDFMSFLNFLNVVFPLDEFTSVMSPMWFLFRPCSSIITFYTSTIQ